MSDLRTAVKQVINKVERHKELYTRSEQSVRDQLINPILKTLGWDTSDPDLVHTNVTNNDGKIPDYVLLKNGKIRLVVEAKRFSKNLDDNKIIKQLADYCYPEGYEFGILTDGIVWQLFNTFERNPSNRIVWSLDISQCEDHELTKLEMFCYDRIEGLEMQLNQTNLLDNYFASIFETKNALLKWCEFSLRDKFIKDNKDYKHREEVVQKYISQKLGDIFLSNLNPVSIDIGRDSANVIVESERPSMRTQMVANNNSVQQPCRNYDINAPFDLAFTKILNGCVENEAVKNWNSLLSILLKQLILSSKSISDILYISNLNIQEGQLSDNGFNPIEGTTYSLQNVDANKCGRAMLLLAKKYNKRVEIDFVWRDRPKAAFPNEYGKIQN